MSRKLQSASSIYDTPRKVDFLVINKAVFPDGLIIECKWQGISGSVDEKFPYLVGNIIKTGVPSIVLLDGGGYKRGAEQWLRKQTEGVPLLKSRVEHG